MSLELAIAENTKAIYALIDAIEKQQNVKPVALKKVEEKQIKEVVNAEEPVKEVVNTETKELEQSDVNAALVKVVQSKGKDAALGILAGFGVQRASDLPKEKRAEFIEACNATLAEGE